MHKGFITISEASKILHVHPNTLRNWEKKYILVPYRDKNSNYRYYSKAQIETFLRLKTSRNINLSWEFDTVEADRLNDLEKAKESYILYISTPLFPIYDKTKSDEYKSLLHRAAVRGIYIRLLTNKKISELRAFSKELDRLSIETRLMRIQGVSFWIADNKRVAIEIGNSNPEKWMRILISKKSVAEKFTAFFESQWNQALPALPPQDLTSEKKSSLPVSTILFP